MKERSVKVVMVDDNLVVVDLKGMGGKGVPCMMNEEAFIGPMNLRGEVIRVRGSHADLQSYEDTTGLMVGHDVTLTGNLLEIELGPGLIGSTLDGLGNVLAGYGDFIARGKIISPLDRSKRWSFEATARDGDEVSAGAVIGVVAETPLVEHRVMVPPLAPSGRVRGIKSGEFTVEDTIATVVDADGGERAMKMMQRWPIRIPRPVAARQALSSILNTGIRIIDGFNPVMLGGTACTPGDFGTGKTMCQHDLARHSRVKIVVYVGCGERAGEMVELMTEFPKLVDPDTGRPLMERTVLFVNTSAMPVAAREGSIMVGATVGEYFRDMGYDVLLLTDSLSRQAQGMREMSGRLGEIPGPQAFPAYMSAYLTRWFERAGKVICLGGEKDRRMGSMTTVAALSPDGGDIAGDPPTQAAIQTAKVSLILSRKRAAARLFPAFDPLECHSKYLDTYTEALTRFFEGSELPLWLEYVQTLRDAVVQGERIRSQMEILGERGIADAEYRRLLLGDIVQKGYLNQNTFDEHDRATGFTRHYAMMRFLVRLIDVFPQRDKTSMRRLQEDLLFDITQANYSAEFESAYEAVLNRAQEAGR
ncbi:MAG: V-type ATP synthase subunit A [Proteobacteria bacterium]|nr:V-type ATP synthase subunit A [Pseudomonadota bacterium]